MKIVTDGHGSYAIRKGFIFHKYKDLTCGYWWDKNSSWFNDCWTSDLDLIKHKFGKLNPKEFKEKE